MYNSVTSNTNSAKDTIINEVLPLIPNQIIMYPPTSENIQNHATMLQGSSLPRKTLFCYAEDKTIQNYKEKIFNEVMEKDPKISRSMLESVESEIEYIISKRIVIGSK